MIKYPEGLAEAAKELTKHLNTPFELFSSIDADEANTRNKEDDYADLEPTTMESMMDDDSADYIY